MTEIELRLSPTEAHDNTAIRNAAAQKLGINPLTISDLQIIRRSVDAMLFSNFELLFILRGLFFHPNLHF